MECGWGLHEVVVMWLIRLRSKGQMVAWGIGFITTPGHDDSNINIDIIIIFTLTV